MKIVEVVKANVKEAMLNKQPETLLALRMLQSKAQNVALRDKRKELTEEDMKVALRQSIKQVKEEMEAYLGIDSPVANNNYTKAYKAHEIYKKFMPEQMTEEAIEEIVDEVIADTVATSLKDMGRVMEFVTAATQDRADRKLVSKIVKSKLS